MHPPHTTLRAYYVDYVDMSYIVGELVKFEGWVTLESLIGFCKVEQKNNVFLLGSVWTQPISIPAVAALVLCDFI